MSTSTKTDDRIEFTTIIKAEPDDGGFTVTFEHSREYTMLNFIWKENDNFNADNTNVDGEDGCKWTELIATGDREAAGLIKALVELGDQLRPIHEQMKSETQAEAGEVA